MNKTLLCLFGLLFIVQLKAQEPPPKRELRGAWIATFSNIDWPNRSQTPAQQQTALINILDHHKATGINAIYFQVRSQCDALYASTIEPWSADLTGTQGKAPNPLWDPMKFAADECHKRGMEFHAWINPYRAVSSAPNLSGFAANHVAKQHPDWLLNNGTTITLDPGNPAVRDYIISVISDILQRYDVDGIHFDDYFYPPGTFNDNASFTADPRGFTVRADWRRDNVNMLIQRVYQTVKDIKPWVKFGVSPSGIYRNSTNPLIGTNTSGSEHYNAVFADTKKWLEQGWVDYIEPQVYWYMGQPGANYTIIVPWWNNNANGRHIYIGMAGYKVNDATQGAPWTNPSMIPNEVRLNRNNSNVKGQAIYNTTSLRAANRLGFRDSLRLFFYQKPSLQPTMPWRDNTPPQPASALHAVKYGNDSVVLHWTVPPPASNELDKVKRFVVYRSQDPAINLNDANNILVITPNDTSAFADKTIIPNTTYYYTVTALDHFHNESSNSNIVADLSPSITCAGNQELSADVNCIAVLPDYTALVTATQGTTVSQMPEAGTSLGTGGHTVTITAVNPVGQMAECSFTVTVKDNTPPVINTTGVPEGRVIELSTNAESCRYMAGTELDISATDNCSGVLTASFILTHDGGRTDTIYSNSLSGIAFEKGLTEIFWMVEDAAGNVSSYTYSVNVIDTEQPVITSCPADITVGTDAGICSATVNPGLPVATDNCGVTSIVGLRSDGKSLNAPYPKGSTSITWTVKDAAGNSASCIQAIMVHDNEPPVITGASADPSSLWPPNHKMKKITVAYTATDNCAVVSTVLSVSSNEASVSTDIDDEDNDWEVLDQHHVRLRAERDGNGNGRVYTITITATDAAGNVQTKNVEVLVPHDHNDITVARSNGVQAESNTDGLAVHASPNPSREGFMILLSSSSTRSIQLRVIDNNGRLIEERSGLAANNTIYLGSKWKAGLYFIEVSQDGKKQLIRLVKQ